MPDPRLSRFEVPPAKREAIAALTRVPVASPAAFGLLVLSVSGIVVTDVLAVLGHLPLVWACALNTFLMYWQFTVVHDAIHRSAARNQKFNDWIGTVSLLTFAPQVTLAVFRWAHVQHHRFTNGPKDPDNWMHGRWWMLPMRWVMLDIGYFAFVLRHGDATAMRHMRGVIRNLVLTVIVCATLIYLGYGLELLLLWFVPARLTFIFVGFAFFWLPHVKNDVTSEEDLTLASSVRFGRETVMTPVLQFHNYHLIHHLFPTMPSYQHLKAWRVLEPELMRRRLQVQHGFGIQPVVHNGVAS